MPTLNSRAYCEKCRPKRFAGTDWKSSTDADADLKDHNERLPSHIAYADIEELQTAAYLKEHYPLQKEMLLATLNLLENATEGNDEVGACIVVLPTGAKCYQLTKQQCDIIKGNFIGGKCQ